MGMAGEPHELFRQWLTNHKGLLFKVVRAYADAPEDQEDLFQEILFQLWRSMPAFEGRAKETTWIYRVALNTALAWRRVETRHRKRQQRLFEFSIDSAAANPAEDLRARRLVESLYTAIRQLPKPDASLVLMHLDGLSYQEMAEVLGISVNHVGVKLNRIKKQLAELLKGPTDEL